MQDSANSRTYLAKLSNNGAVEQRFRLSENQGIVLGREPQCHIAVDPFLYGSVSRQHARIESISSPNSGLVWQICDLNSANGTYLNGQRIYGSTVLQRGDRITLGKNGPEFLFECQSVHQANSPQALSRDRSASNASTPAFRVPAYTPPISQTDITRSQLFPIFSHRQDLTQKAYLLPAAVTIVFVLLMFASLGTEFFNLLLATYISGAIYYFIYQFCGKNKPW